MSINNVPGLIGWAALIAATATVSGCAQPSASIPTGAAAYEVVPPPTPGKVTREYLLGPLDTISIAVFQEPDLSVPNAVIDASGNVLLPLIGSVHAAGKTSTELSGEIAARLEQYLVRPQVSVLVAASVSQKVTIEGSVGQPGVYAIQGRTTLIEALAMARGTSRVAALDQVVVFREIDGRPAFARFNYQDIRMGRQPNPEILGNDIVVVGFSGIKGAYRDFIAASPLISAFVYLSR